MSIAYHEEFNWSHRGMNAPKEANVCAEHIEDYAIKRHILKEGEKGVCSYCDNDDVIVMSLEFLVEFINNSLNYFYDDAGNNLSYESSEGGYQGASTFDIEELLYSTIEFDDEDEELRQDILNAFDRTKAWCEDDPYADREDMELKYNWSYFKQIVKHQCRFVFGQSRSFKTGSKGSNVYEILDDIGRRVDTLNMFTELPVGTKYFRCRQHDKAITIKDAKELVSPPLKYAVIANRMSPAGISMFYCSFDPETAQSETVQFARPDSACSNATFGSKESFNLLDLSKLPQIPSIFDEQNRANYYSVLFLRDFIEDFTAEVKRDGIEHIEYVPTQIVTEYFKHIYESLSHILVEGIIYPSSKNPGHNACVLFLDYNASLKAMEMIDIERKVI